MAENPRNVGEHPHSMDYFGEEVEARKQGLPERVDPDFAQELTYALKDHEVPDQVVQQIPAKYFFHEDDPERPPTADLEEVEVLGEWIRDNPDSKLSEAIRDRRSPEQKLNEQKRGRINDDYAESVVQNMKEMDIPDEIIQEMPTSYFYKRDDPEYTNQWPQSLKQWYKPPAVDTQAPATQELPALERVHRGKRLGRWLRDKGLLALAKIEKDDEPEQLVWPVLNLQSDDSPEPPRADTARPGDFRYARQPRAVGRAFGKLTDKLLRRDNDYYKNYVDLLAARRNTVRNISGLNGNRAISPNAPGRFYKRLSRYQNEIHGLDKAQRDADIGKRRIVTGSASRPYEPNDKWGKVIDWENAHKAIVAKREPQFQPRSLYKLDGRVEHSGEWTTTPEEEIQEQLDDLGSRPFSDFDNPYQARKRIRENPDYTPAQRRSEKKLLKEYMSLYKRAHKLQRRRVAIANGTDRTGRRLAKKASRYTGTRTRGVSPSNPAPVF